MLRPALVGATFSRRRSWSRAFVLLLVALTLALPASAGAAIGQRATPLSNPDAAGRPLAVIGGRSAAAKHVQLADLVRHGAVAPLTGPAAPAPERLAPTTAPLAPQPKPVLPQATTVATTTTLQATPNPAVYPAQVHLVGTVSPAPQPSGGFTPVVSFYVDGDLRGIGSIDPTTGQGSDDLSLAPGTYEIVAQFDGIGTYEASSSSPVTQVVVQAPPLATETGAAALQASAGFAGVAGTTAAPIANPSLGVGPRDIVQMSESGVRFYERSGSPLFQMSLTDFFDFEPLNGQAGTPRSPRVLFDALRGRWIASEVTHGDAFGHLYIAASETDSFVDGWWIYRFDFPNEAPTNPSLGLSFDKIAVGYDVQTIGGEITIGSTVLVVSYANLLAHVDTLPYTRTSPSGAYQAWRPAQNLSAGNVVHVVGWDPASHHLHYLSAAGTVTGPGTGVTFNLSDLTSGSAALPGTGSNGSMLGPTNALWKDNHLWFVSTRECAPTGDPFSQECVRVTKLATPSLALEQDFAIGRSGYASYLGGIGIAGDGSLVVAYSQVGTNPSPGPQPISTYATIQVPGDAANSVRPSQLISAGVPRCPAGPTCGNGNGGGSAAYLAVAADPVDSHAVWQGAMHTVSGGWATWISRLTGATAPPAGSFTLAGGRTVTNSLRLGITPQPNATATATQMLISNSPTTAGGKLSAAKQLPIGARVPWSLADTSTGGSSATGSRTVYVQWGNGIATWSTVQSRTITVGTPLGAAFVPLNPARLLDSRSGNGLSGPFRHRVPRSFQITGRGGVPANAVAVTGNLTVTRQTSGGYVFLGPTATTTPTSSTLNFPLTDIRANGVTVKLSPTGKLGAVFVGSSSARTTDLVFDVTGYMLADDPNAPKGGTFVAITPTRFLDTRVPLGLAGRFTSRVPRTFCITGCGPVPGDATAVTGNLTVTGQTSAGYLFLGPTPTGSPTSSTLNFPKADIRANNVTVRLDADGNLSAVFVGTSSATTNVVFDVTGYFVQGPWGATFIPLDPARILDTRSGVGLSGRFSNHVPRAFATAGQGGVPATGTVGVTGNLTVAGQTAGGFAFLGPTASANPTSSTLNIPVGDIRANGIDVGLAVAGTLSAVWVSPAASTTAMIFDVGGYFR